MLIAYNDIPVDGVAQSFGLIPPIAQVSGALAKTLGAVTARATNHVTSIGTDPLLVGVYDLTDPLVGATDPLFVQVA